MVEVDNHTTLLFLTSGKQNLNIMGSARIFFNLENVYLNHDRENIQDNIK